MDLPSSRAHQKIKVVEINSYLTCYLCKGYLIDATTISECLHSFCRSCIIKFLQKNCYCPVCEVIINKAKPCLKLDKTLQDVVYKLIPSLFVKEMKRRKLFYMEHPALAAKVSPEERGEDTERTIFNPQDDISLSIEYVSDDSTPGAIPMLPSTQVDQKPNEPHDNPMKRYLQCPGGCRIDVLKKFLVNKYNIDTNLFHIDILYKRVPLPDHYTLIDIGYIFSWKRNEPMKFFFRITDINKVSERFDYFDGRPKSELVFKPPRATRSEHRERTSRSTPKKNNDPTTAPTAAKKEIKLEKNSPATIKKEEREDEDNKCTQNKKTTTPSANSATNKQVNKREKTLVLIKSEKTDKVVNNSNNSETTNNRRSGVVNKVTAAENKAKQKQSTTNSVGKTVNCSDHKVQQQQQQQAKQEPPKRKMTISVSAVATPKNSIVIKSESADDLNKANKVQTQSASSQQQQQQHQQQQQNDLKDRVYTNITLNRDNNVEIITKIQKVSNKEGQQIGLNIIKNTVQKSTNSNKLTENKSRANNNIVSNNSLSKAVSNGSCSGTGDNISDSIGRSSSTDNVINNATLIPKIPVDLDKERGDEIAKSNFLRSIELTARTSLPPNNSAPPAQTSPKAGTSNSHQQSKKNTNKCESPVKTADTLKPETSKPEISSKPQTPKANNSLKTESCIGKGASPAQKRKNSSPLKNDKLPEKKPKTEKRPVKIIIQPKGISNPAIRQIVSNVNQNANTMSRIVEQTNQTSKTTAADLQSLIDNCKLNIPSSLSITLNEGTDGKVRTAPSIPPVKNYIEILKIPDNSVANTTRSVKSDVERKDELSNKSSITKTATPKSSPNANNTSNTSPKESKPPLLSSFQKIFEESIKKTPLESTSATQTHQVINKIVISSANSGGIKLQKVDNTNSKSCQQDSHNGDSQKSTTPLDLTASTVNDSSVNSKIATTITPAVTTVNSNNRANKRNLHEITSKLHNKKTKIEQDKKNDATNISMSSSTSSSSRSNSPTSKLTIPRVPIQTLKPSIVPAKYDLSSPAPPQNHVHKTTTASLHSPNLGMNYTVSVNQNKTSKIDVKTAEVKKDTLVPLAGKSPPNSHQAAAKKSPNQQPSSTTTTPNNHHASRAKSLSPSGAAAANNNNKSGHNNPKPPAALSPNQLLEKYKIQNIAQYTAQFQFNPAAAHGFISAMAAANGPASTQAMNAALKHAMLFNHHRHNPNSWYGMPSPHPHHQQAPLLHYDKYLQSMNSAQGATTATTGAVGQNALGAKKLMGNLKEN